MLHNLGYPKARFMPPNYDAWKKWLGLHITTYLILNNLLSNNN